MRAMIGKKTHTHNAQGGLTIRRVALDIRSRTSSIVKFLMAILFFSSVPVWAEMADEAYQTLISQLRSKQFEEGYKTAKYYADRGSVCPSSYKLEHSTA